MGFTPAAARSAFSPNVAILVAELVPEIVGWARGPLAHLFGDSLDDPRVIAAFRDVHDAILLDVDNGPEGFTALESPFFMKVSAASLSRVFVTLLSKSSSS